MADVLPEKWMKGIAITTIVLAVGDFLKRREMWIVGFIIGSISLVYLANGFLLFFG